MHIFQSGSSSPMINSGGVNPLMQHMSSVSSMASSNEATSGNSNYSSTTMINGNNISAVGVPNGVAGAAHAHLATNGSVGYSSGGIMAGVGGGVIRTNLNNIDYAANGTIYRRSGVQQQQQRTQTVSSIEGDIQAQQQQQTTSSRISAMQQASSYMPFRAPPTTRTSIITNPNMVAINQYHHHQQHQQAVAAVDINMDASLPPPPPPASLTNQFRASDRLSLALHSTPQQQQQQQSPVEELSVSEQEMNLQQAMLAAAGDNNEIGHHQHDDNIGDLENDNGDDDDDDIIPNWVPLERCLEKCVAMFDYEAARADELSFTEHTVIYVLKKNDDLWYEGVMCETSGGAARVFQGLFPYNYARCVRKYVDDTHITQC